MLNALGKDIPEKLDVRLDYCIVQNYCVIYGYFGNGIILYWFARIPDDKLKDTEIEFDPLWFSALFSALASMFQNYYDNSDNGFSGGVPVPNDGAYSYYQATDEVIITSENEIANSGTSPYTKDAFLTFPSLLFPTTTYYYLNPPSSSTISVFCSIAGCYIAVSTLDYISAIYASTSPYGSDTATKEMQSASCLYLSGKMSPEDYADLLHIHLGNDIFDINTIMKKHKKKSLWDILKDLIFGEDELDKALSARPPRDPLVIDLGEEGIELHSIENGVYFDLDKNGYAEKTAWIGTEDGFLAYDRNNNEKIDNGGELFGDQVILKNGSKSVSGFDALRELDNDGNGFINSSDESYQQLLVWIDSNHNGKSERKELFALADLGIEKISLDYSRISLVDEETGTRIADTADVTTVSGLTQIREFWFPVRSSDSVHNDKNTVGNVPDVMQAIEEDETGVLKGYFDKFSEATEVSTKYYYLKKILYFITDSEGIAPNSRGSNIDARDLHVIECFMGREFIGIDGENPNDGAASILKNLYNRIEEDYYCYLNMHCALGGYLHATYEYEDENGNTKLHLDFLNYILENKKTNGENIDCILYDLGIYLKVYDRMNGTTSYQDYADTYESEKPFIVNTITDKYTYVCTDDDDNYVGTAFNDNIFGLGGDDKLHGSNGNDLICGGTGKDELYGDSGNDELCGDDGDDIIHGNGGNDTLNGGLGNDILRGGSGNDTYKFDKGYGKDTIDEENWNSPSDKVVFGEDITGNDIVLSRNGNNMILSIKGTDDSIEIVKQYYDSWYRVETFEFADGTVLTADDLYGISLVINGSGEINDYDSGYGTRNTVLIGSDSDDIINGYSGDDVLDGKAGNDILYGGSGNDTYIFGKGYGQDIINEDNWNSTGDKILFVGGITEDDIIIDRDGDNMVISIKDTDDSLVIIKQYSDPWYRIEDFEYADETSDNNDTGVNESMEDTSADNSDDISEGDFKVSFEVKDGYIRLEWDTVPDAEQYALAAFVNGNWKLQTYFDANTTVYTSTKLPAGNYKVVVCARIGGEWKLKHINERALEITIK